MFTNNYGCRHGLEYDRDEKKGYFFADFEKENYGWNYYPQSQNSFDQEEYYRKEDDCREEQHSPCRRPFFPCFNRRHMDCDNKRCCKCPCHDRPSEEKRPNKNCGYLYFTGKIEIKNCNER